MECPIKIVKQGIRNDPEVPEAIPTDMPLPKPKIKRIMVVILVINHREALTCFLDKYVAFL